MAANVWFGNSVSRWQTASGDQYIIFKWSSNTQRRYSYYHMLCWWLYTCGWHAIRTFSFIHSVWICRSNFCFSFSFHSHFDFIGMRTMFAAFSVWQWYVRFNNIICASMLASLQSLMYHFKIIYIHKRNMMTILTYVRSRTHQLNENAI